MDKIAVDELLGAMSHPKRRAMLAGVALPYGAFSYKDSRAEMGVPLSGVSHHARVLVPCDSTELVDTPPVRGSVQHFHPATELLRHPLAEAILDPVGNVEDGAKPGYAE